MRHKVRRWDSSSEDDPLAGLANLFDLWMVFSIALLVALVSASRLPESSTNRTGSKETQLEAAPSTERTKLETFRMSLEKLTGEGQRLGTAYRLMNGEVVYVPD